MCQVGHPLVFLCGKVDYTVVRNLLTYEYDRSGVSLISVTLSVETSSRLTIAVLVRNGGRHLYMLGPGASVARVTELEAVMVMEFKIRPAFSFGPASWSD